MNLTEKNEKLVEILQNEQFKLEAQSLQTAEDFQALLAKNGLELSLDEVYGFCAQVANSMNQEELSKLLQMLALDVSEPGRDNKTGHGVPVLPALSKKYITMTTNSQLYRVNGEEKKMDTQPVNIEGRVFVPVRVIAEALGATVGYKLNGDGTVKVLIDKAGTHIELNTGCFSAYINGDQVLLDCMPFLDENDRTLVPIRFIAEGLGCKVDWVQSEAKVMVLEL